MYPTILVELCHTERATTPSRGRPLSEEAMPYLIGTRLELIIHGLGELTDKKTSAVELSYLWFAGGMEQLMVIPHKGDNHVYSFRRKS